MSGGDHNNEGRCRCGYPYNFSHGAMRNWERAMHQHWHCPRGEVSS